MVTIRRVIENIVLGLVPGTAISAPDSVDVTITPVTDGCSHEYGEIEKFVCSYNNIDFSPDNTRTNAKRVNCFAAKENYETVMDEIHDTMKENCYDIRLDEAWQPGVPDGRWIANDNADGNYSILPRKLSFKRSV